MTASLRTAADYAPRSLTAKGKTYRFVNVDSQVTVEGATATVRADGREQHVAVTPAFSTIDGYAPFSAQMMMLRYSKGHGRPRVMQTAPFTPCNRRNARSR